MASQKKKGEIVSVKLKPMVVFDALTMENVYKISNGPSEKSMIFAVHSDEGFQTVRFTVVKCRQSGSLWVPGNESFQISASLHLMAPSAARFDNGHGSCAFIAGYSDSLNLLSFFVAIYYTKIRKGMLFPVSSDCPLAFPWRLLPNVKMPSEFF